MGKQVLTHREGVWGICLLNSLLLLVSFPVHGLRDLFWLPIEQYRKDGRIIRGLQRGAASFGTSTASAALELSNRLVQAIQVGLDIGCGLRSRISVGLGKEP